MYKLWFSAATPVILIPLLLSSCTPSPYFYPPVSMNMFYYPKNPSLCPGGVRAKGALPEQNPQSVFEDAQFLQWRQNDMGYWFEDRRSVYKGESGSSGRMSAISFLLDQETTSPTLNEALTQFPMRDLKKWDHYYVVSYFPTNQWPTPTISVQCRPDTPILDMPVPAGDDSVLLVIEDPSVPAQLRLVKVATR